jgi:peptidoglycan hydrolase-like protein with peptidoglycan-binding domain
MMDIRGLQSSVNSSGWKPPLTVDGVPGRNTMRAIDSLLSHVPRRSGDPEAWSDARKLIAIEQAFYNAKGLDAGNVDGLIGEQTRYARRAWDAREANKGQPVDGVENFRRPDETPVAARRCRDRRMSPASTEV